MEQKGFWLLAVVLVLELRTPQKEVNYQLQVNVMCNQKQEKTVDIQASLKSNVVQDNAALIQMPQIAPGVSNRFQQKGKIKLSPNFQNVITVFVKWVLLKLFEIDTRTNGTKETELPPHPYKYFLQIMVKAHGLGNVDKYAILLPMLLEILVSRAFMPELFTDVVKQTLFR
ncbi:hypothetical protein KIL84_020033 [Mauremys mutica]|uniref:Uncharacterized protein n=1 Tax=Mauremys mutica TaxID=74926 RepID=A0A9D3XTD1_9SAUR|nr:hypothetical protein KIL84_020033 [Mauremys mutica]